MSVRVSTLASGLRVVTHSLPHLKTASLGLYFGAGARHEREEEHGLAHMLEHMAFKGTRRRSAKQIAEAIEDVGGDLNAETSIEQTAYFARVLGEDVDLALDVLADIVTDSQFAPDELEREKGVIVQEIGAVEDTPDDWVFDLFTERAWPDQAVGRPILGTRATVGAFDRRAIAAYLERCYGPGVAVLAAAGAVDHDALASSVADKLKGLAASAPPHVDDARYVGGDAMVKRPLEQTHVVIGFPGVGALHDDHDALHAFAGIVGGGMSSRLFQEVREKRGLAYAIHAFHWGYADSGLFGLYAGAAAKDAGELIRASLDCLVEATEKIDAMELARIKAQMKVATLTALESPGARAGQLARQMFLYGRPMSLEAMIARIESITLESVKDAGRKALRGAPTVAAIGKIGRVLDSARVGERVAGI